jgi:hypothetical protein
MTLQRLSTAPTLERAEAQSTTDGPHCSQEDATFMGKGQGRTRPWAQFSCRRPFEPSWLREHSQGKEHC